MRLSTNQFGFLALHGAATRTTDERFRTQDFTSAVDVSAKAEHLQQALTVAAIEVRGRRATSIGSVDWSLDLMCDFSGDAHKSWLPPPALKANQPKVKTDVRGKRRRTLVGKESPSERLTVNISPQILADLRRRSETQHDTSEKKRQTQVASECVIQ
ncbi:hypothetical protein BIW11_11938 [Tropilaelaps mercedesae]|uniref:Uncharacterized protein n=1 Tax=Tropilaelaps mercedesae TaxID=418985 RepID=A0A1V9X8V1_9ACAR|nr:hypothetical protein BIW11_11938 [Tropilaelaps mercedesae]